MPVVRAAAHIHSARSDDGTWPLERIAREFATRGYRAVLLAEHCRGLTDADWKAHQAACAEASTPELLLVPGIEYNDADNVVHVTVWGEVGFFGDGPDIGELLPAVTGAGGVCVLAHPWRREAWRRVRPDWYPHLTGVEVWNRKYDGLAPNRRSLDLARNHGLREFVSLDLHTSRQFYPLAVDVRLPGEVTVGAVYGALRAGEFEATAFGQPATRYFRGVRLRGVEAVERSRRVARPLVGRLRPHS